VAERFADEGLSTKDYLKAALKQPKLFGQSPETIAGNVRSVIARFADDGLTTRDYLKAALKHGLRPRTYPGSTTTPDLVQDDAEADRQLGTPVGGVQPWLTQEGEQLMPMVPHVLRQRLVGHVCLGSGGTIFPSTLTMPSG
jgi:hypothetical protein